MVDTNSNKPLHIHNAHMHLHINMQVCTHFKWNIPLSSQVIMSFQEFTIHLSSFASLLIVVVTVITTAITTSFATANTNGNTAAVVTDFSLTTSSVLTSI